MGARGFKASLLSLPILPSALIFAMIEGKATYYQRKVNKLTISREDVEYVAALARLELTEPEIQEYTEQLNSILDYAAMLERLETDDVVPTAHAVPLHNVMREDQVRSSINHEKALRNAPDGEEGFFRVPKISLT
jgi:aspartyl-tRNA(Asn)/glutamyl-tRNA(Gln) amidotransferase subunit C